MTVADDLALALSLVDHADTLTTAVFRRADLVVETKPDLTPVTAADRDTELAVRSQLATSRPDDAVVGEELGSTGDSHRRWIIDPIDGTKNFVRGIPVWATLLALEVDGVLTVGVVSAPALGRRWWAGRGLGAFAGPCPGNGGPVAAGVGGPGPLEVGGPVAVGVGGPGPFGVGAPIRVSGVRELADAQLSGAGSEGWLAHGGPSRLMALTARCWRDRAFGDFWSHVLVAEGACDIGLDPVASLWDLAPLQVIVEEAGGTFTDLSGSPTAGGGSAISTNGHLHAAALAALGSHGA